MADSLIVACVRSGDKHGLEHVTALRDAVALHLRRPYEMVCLTDRRERCGGVSFIDITAADFTGRWARMMLFEPQWRAWKKIICLALDVIVAGDLAPLADVPGEFSICERHADACRYDSSVMVIGTLMGDVVWRGFERRRERLLAKHKDNVDACIEELYQRAPLLQRRLPGNFFRARLII